MILRTLKKRRGLSYLRGNRELIIPRTLSTSVITYVLVYLGIPRKALRQIPGIGARNGLRLTITTNTHLPNGTVSATQETITLYVTPVVEG
jgi:hypothetical protein